MTSDHARSGTKLVSSIKKICVFETVFCILTYFTVFSGHEYGFRLHLHHRDVSLNEKKRRPLFSGPFVSNKLNLRNIKEGKKMAKPAIIEITCWKPVPPISLALGNISKNMTYRTVPIAIAKYK